LPEERVLRQLTEALLFERLATWSSEQHPPHRAVDKELGWQLGAGAYTCAGRVGAFGRVRVVPGSVRKLAQGAARATSWQEVLSDVPCDSATREAIADELANTARLCSWNLAHLPSLRESRRHLSYEQLESALHEGHPYHPCFKARTGFSLDDHAAYGPESASVFSLRWLAVRRSSLAASLPTAEDDFYCSALGADAWAQLEQAQRRFDAPLADYGLLPVHPWQWQKLSLKPALAAALASRELIALEVEVGRYRATQSLRTLLPVDEPLRPHLKLPLAVRVSSSLRTLEVETVRAAPVLSRWLKSRVASDPFFEQVAGATVLSEYASAAHLPATDASELVGHLAAIWREPIAAYLRPDESALPFNALFCREHDGRPFIDPWLRRHGVSSWVARLLRVTLLPLWRLLAHHGIALEAHAQNLLLVHEDGVPRRIALRDFHDSLEYVPSFLREPADVPDFAAIDERFRNAPPNRYYATVSVVGLRDLFIDTVMVFNLCELSWLLERQYGFSEVEFWRIARGVLADYRRSSWHDAEREARLRPRAPLVDTESLFKARLRAPSDALFQHTVVNALHEVNEREIHARHQ
jgi:3,4-dihydroxybenzoyl-citryl-spermidine/N-citryl-spermidine--spermidine ligase